MLSLRTPRIRAFNFAAIVLFLLAGCPLCRAQAALLLEQPYGFFGEVNPTGHSAIYLARICAATPVKLRRCGPGEPGVVIARYQGIDGYDWIAIPLVPYLYAVDDVSDVPSRVDRATVQRLRNDYRDIRLKSLGKKVDDGNLVHGGWTQLVGAAYERRIYAFRFETTAAQDDALLALLNDRPNHSEFNLLYSNCADFARTVLNGYFPGKFKRNVFPDAGMTTPKQIAFKLMRLGRRYPELHATVLEIPQIPGYRRQSHSNKDVAESIATTIYAVPIALVNPYLAGGIFADYLIRGRFHIIPKHPQVLGPDKLAQLASPVPSITQASGDGTASPDIPVLALAGGSSFEPSSGSSEPEMPTSESDSP